MKGFRNFMSQGNVVVAAVGLVVALAFSGLIKAFTTAIINPIVNRAQGDHPIALGVQLGSANSTSTFVNIGELISAIVYFVVFMAVVYFVIITPYKHVQARRGVTVFGAAAPVKTCPFCLSNDLPVAATRCKYCAADLGSDGAPAPAGASAAGAPPVV